MNINQTKSFIVHRAWNRNRSVPRYESFWDGHDYNTDFNNEDDLIAELVEAYDPNWQKDIDLHQVRITEERVK